MGGTFDPIHIGHLLAASEAWSALHLDQVIFVPAGEPWQKTGYSAAEDRFLMTTLATAGHPAFAVSRLEIDRRGPTYTVDTLQTLRASLGAVDLFFIGGADAIGQMGTWNRVDELAELAEVVALTRPGHALQAEIPPGWPKVHALEMPLIGVSATDIRERVRAQRPIDFLVPPPVVAYIERQGLYVGQREGQSA